jgi:hypothetical protein
MKKLAMRACIATAFLIVSISFSSVLVQGAYYPSGLVSWWPAEGNANDIYGSNHGTLNGASFASGKVGQAFSFSPRATSGDSVLVLNDASLNPSAITVDAWFYANSISDGDPIVEKTGWIIVTNGGVLAGLDYGYKLGIRDDGKVYFTVYIQESGGSAGFRSSPGASVSTGLWYHVAGTYDGSTIKLYLNGALVGSTSVTGTIIHSQLGLAIGALESGALMEEDYEYFIGLIDEAEIFSRALSEAEIAQIVEGIKQGSPTIDSCDSTGVKKDTFVLSDDVYAMGTGYRAQTTYDVYVVEDVTWVDGMAIPPRVAGTATTVTSDASGDVPATLLWSNPLVAGKYDIVVDVDGDGLYYAEVDAVDDNDIEVTAGFFVVPEVTLGSIMAATAMFTSLGLFAYKKKHTTK